jgi:hypothetical protein
MRSILVALAVLAAPAAARADLSLRLELFDAGAQRPRQHLDVPSLALHDPALLAVTDLDDGGGAGRHARADPVVCLILGIIPGFGLGHYLAGSDQWPIWLIADLVIFVVWPGGFFITNDRTYAFLGLLVLVERVIQGITAYEAAGGKSILHSSRFAGGPDVAPADLSLPVGARAAALR